MPTSLMEMNPDLNYCSGYLYLSNQLFGTPDKFGFREYRYVNNKLPAPTDDVVLKTVPAVPI
jgi:hypothetical protein